MSRAPFPRRILASGIRGYQAISAWTQPRCRYLPTCSEYALDAVERHGAARGTWLGLRRLARCHPWGGHGYDPVPDVPDPSPTDRTVGAAR